MNRVGRLGVISVSLLLVMPGAGSGGEAGSNGPGDEAEALLAKSRETIGTPPGTASLWLEGSLVERGTEGSFVWRINGPRDSQVRTDALLGENHDTVTGQVWEATGVVRSVRLEELHWREALGALVSGWWLTEESPLEVETADRDNLQLTLRHRDGPLRIRLDLDGDRRPRTLHYRSLQGHVQVRFEAWSTVEGLQVPHRVEQRVDDHVNVLFTVSGVRQLPLSAEPLEGPSREASDVTWGDPAHRRVALETADTGHRLLRASLNGSDMGWFVLDTGGGASLVTPRTAEALKLERVGTTVLTSIFGTVETAVYRAGSLTVGALTLERPVFTEMDLEFLSQALGRPIAGLIGYNVFARSRATIDLVANTLELASSQAEAEDDLPWQELTLHHRHPAVEAGFPGGRGLFRLDVGAAGPGGSLVFHTPTVEDYALADPSDPIFPVGQEQMRFGSVPWFELAGRRFEDVPALFGQQREGIFGDPYTAGNVGVEILKAFSLVLDYPRSRIAFVPQTQEEGNQGNPAGGG